MRRIVLAVLLFAAGSVRAQENRAQPPPAPPKVDPSGEVDKLKESCGAFKILPCAEELFTGKPVHIAVGSIAPQNGFGAGLAYLGHKTTDNWRIGWNSDAIGSINGSWRAGFYLKFVDTHQKPIGGGFGTKGKKKPRVLSELPEHPVLNLYVQAISLNKLTYFGLGPATTLAGRTFYGMTQTIVGGSAVKPFYERLNASLYGEINGRFVNIRPSTGQPSPSIATLYSEATAPGLTNQPGTLQLGEGIRIRPVYFDDFLRLNYSLAYQQFFTPGNSTFSSQRLTADLYHEFALYKKTTRNLLPRDNNPNGPDDCSLSTDPNHPECPAITRDREGNVGLRFYLATRHLHDAGRQCGALLLSADTRRGGHQRQSFAQQLSRFSSSRSQCHVLSPELGALHLGAARIFHHGGGRQSWLEAWGPRLQSLDPQFCVRPHAACWRLSPGVPALRLGRQRRHAHHRQRQYFLAGRFGAAILVLARTSRQDPIQSIQNLTRTR